MCIICLLYAIMLCMKIDSWMEGFSEYTVYVHVHTLYLNNQYLTLL